VNSICIFASVACYTEERSTDPMALCSHHTTYLSRECKMNGCKVESIIKFLIF